MDKPSPRVNSARLNDYKNQLVRIAGKVVSLHGDVAILEASDKGQVKILLNRDSNLSDPYVEILGRVKEDNLVQEYTSSNLGSSFDLGLMEQVVQLTHARPDMFPTQ